MNSFSLISMPIGVDSAICYRPFGTKPRTKPSKSSLKKAKLYSEKSIVIKKVSIVFGMFNPIAKMAFGYFFRNLENVCGKGGQQTNGKQLIWLTLFFTCNVLETDNQNLRLG